MTNNGKPRGKLSPKVTAGTVIIATVLTIYSFAALFIAIVALGLRNPWFYPIIAYGVVGLAGVGGLLAGRTWGRYCVAVSGLMLIFLSVFGGFPPSVLLLNGAAGLAIFFHVITRKRHSGRKPRVAPDEMTAQQGMSKMPEDQKDIDKLKLELEREKFHWEKSKYAQESNDIFNRHFGVMITAIVSLAAVVVSYLQLSISSNNARAQIDNEVLKNDRQFYFEIAKFLLDRQQDLTTNEIDKVIFLRNVVVSSFPADVAVRIASRMRDTASTLEVRKIWEEAMVFLQAGATSSSTQ